MSRNIVLPEPPLAVDDFRLLSALRTAETILTRRMSRGFSAGEALRPLPRHVRDIRRQVRRAIFPASASLFPLKLASDFALEYLDPMRSGVRSLGDVPKWVKETTACRAALWWTHAKMADWGDLDEHVGAVMRVLKQYRLEPKSREIIPVLRFRADDLTWEPITVLVAFTDTDKAVRFALKEDRFSRTPTGEEWRKE